MHISKEQTSTIKGIAILSVMISHFVGVFGKGFRLFTPLGGIGVCLFIIMSAYGLNESYKKNGLTHWWSKRLIAVFVPYAIFQNIAYWPFNEFDALVYAKDITLISPRQAYGWYLNYLLCWYIVFFVIMAIPLLKRYKMIILGGVSVLSLIFLPEIRAEQAFSFATGIVLSEYKGSERLSKLLSTKKTVAILVAVGVVFLGLKQLSIIRNSPQIIYSIIQLLIKYPIGLGLCMAVASLKILRIKIFEIVGIISFELYLIHGLVLQWVPQNIIGVFLFWILSFAGASIAYFVVEKIQKCLKKFLI